MIASPVKSSETHPLRIQSVCPNQGWAEIGMSLCPGKHQLGGLSGNWKRNLDIDLQAIKSWGAAMVVSLIEEREFAELEVSLLPYRVQAANMQWRHLPIRDNHAPGAQFQQLWPSLGKEIIALLTTGQRVFLHCKGGLGRTGTVAACLLIEAGWEPESAIEYVRSARPRTIETALQEWFVLNYQPQFISGDNHVRA